MAFGARFDKGHDFPVATMVADRGERDRAGMQSTTHPLSSGARVITGERCKERPPFYKIILESEIFQAIYFVSSNSPTFLLCVPHA